MKPRWFEIPDPETDLIALTQKLKGSEEKGTETTMTSIPLHMMWQDDMLWLPFLLAKQRFVGRVDFVDDTPPLEGETSIYHPMVKWWFATID